MMKDNEKSLELDLKLKDDHGRTGFQVAKSIGNHEIINILK